VWTASFGFAVVPLVARMYAGSFASSSTCESSCPAPSREEVLPRHLVLHAFGRGRAPKENDTLDRRRVRDRLRDDPDQRDVLAFAVRHVRREQRASPGEADALTERSGAESREHDQDDDADADRAEHQNDRFGRCRHVDGDAVAPLDAHRAESRADALDLAVEVSVGQGAALAALVLRDQRDARSASRRDVVVNAVVGKIREPTRVPAKGRRLPVENALPLLEPGHLLGGAAPEALGVIRRLALPGEDLRGSRPFRSRSLPQLVPLDLPGHGLGQLGDKFDPPRVLIRSDASLHEALSSSASSSDGFFPFLRRTKAFGFISSSLSFTPTTRTRARRGAP